MLKMTKQNLRKELKKYKLMRLQYASDKSFQKVIEIEINRIESELKFMENNRAK